MIAGPLMVSFLFASMLLLIVMIVKLHIHPFLSLLFVSLFFGLISGIGVDQTLDILLDGFGSIMGSIGIVIVAGIIIGEVLSTTGGARRIASSVLNLIGTRRSVLGANVSGAIVSVPVFSDSGFVLLNPIIRSLSSVGKVPYTSLATALMAGLMTAHVLIPPTPGPIAGAELLGANLGKFALYAVAVAIPIVVVTSLWANSRFVAKKYPQVVAEEEVELQPGDPDTTRTASHEPSLFCSFLPIVVPIALIIGHSISEQFISDDVLFGRILVFVGSPTIALLIGVILAFTLPRKLGADVTNTLVSKAIEKGANILLITSAGGAFGSILQETNVGEFVGEAISESGFPAFLIPFLIAAMTVTAVGSSSVAITTASAIVMPLLDDLNLSPELALLSVSVGSLTVIHANASLFWIVGKMGNMDLKQSYWAITVTSLIMGITGIVSVGLLSVVI